MALSLMLFDILNGPTIWDVLLDLMVFMVPLWVAVIIGVLVGWVWKPEWANLGREADSDSNKLTYFSWSSLGFNFDFVPASFGSFKLQQQLSRFCPWFPLNGELERQAYSLSLKASPSFPNYGQNPSAVVNDGDLRHLSQLVDETDDGPSWIEMMGRSTPNFSYKAWRRDPQTGPPQYCSSTIFEDATPDIVRDFFWDDEFRVHWDDMLIHHSLLEECATTGTMIVQWVRKFPFFCSDREYVIGRRIWQLGKSFYCITKGVHFPSLPRQNKPRRVDLYYSSWCIRPAESRKSEGQMTACEVLLFHHEDMGIPWEIAKLGVRQGMWGAVKKIDPGLRKYQMERASGAPLSHSAAIAHVNTKVDPSYLTCLDSVGVDSSIQFSEVDTHEKHSGVNLPKFLVVSGALVLACSVDKGLLTKAVIFGVARRFARMGRKF